MDDKLAYLNTDLDLQSTEDLSHLAAALEQNGVFPLHVTQGEDNQWYATFETEEQFEEPEATIAEMLKAIETLSESLRLVLARCILREMHLGYQCGQCDNWSLTHGLSSDTLARIAAMGLSLRITLYRQGEEIEIDPDP